MSFKKWLLIFGLTILLCAGALVGFNVAVDPFGVFGDKIMNWYAYNMTNNPRVAKIPYLEAHHEEYDSYVIGCSKTGGLPIEALNQGFDAKFYSMLMYGGDMYDIEKTAEYIIANYQAKNIIINLGLEEAVSYNNEEDAMKGNLHCAVDGSSPLKFYGKYLFANPSYAVDKLVAYGQDSYAPQDFDVFDAATGNYDKRKRDVEAIGDLSTYLAANDNVDTEFGSVNQLAAKEQTLAALAKIKELCDAENINFILIMDPISALELSSYDSGDLQAYWRELAAITDFWDFSGYTSVAYESRYFYDTYHYRTNIGAMMVDIITNNSGNYRPQDFGYHVTAQNVDQRAATAFNRGTAPDAAAYTKSVPILMYHSVGSEGEDYAKVSEANFAAQISALAAAGYTAVTFGDLINYVDYGVELPAKPVVITFDDGYSNNYTLAYPILAQYGFKATVNVIVSSVGQDTYKDTGQAIYPHFTYSQAREMWQSGVMDLQSHSYDCHQVEKYEPKGQYRYGVLPKKGESETAYIEFFRADYQQAKTGLEENVGNQVNAFAYPYGEYTELSEILLSEMGNRVTMTIEPGPNTIIKGLPQSLYALHRYNVNNDVSPAELLDLIN